VTITPFAPDGAVDEAGLRAHIRRLTAAGISLNLAGSGSGEANSLTLDEIDTIYSIGREEARREVPVWAAAIECRNAHDVIQFALRAQAQGLDAFQVTAIDMGHAIQPSPDELEQYFVDVLSAVDMPAILTTHEYLGYLVPLQLLEKLVARFDVIGLICNTRDFSYLLRLLDTFAGDLAVHLGRPELGLGMLELGASGFGMAEANVAPQLCSSVLECYEQGDIATAQSRFALLLRLYAHNLAYGNVRGVKAMLEALGFGDGSTRKPRLPLDEERRLSTAALLRELGIAELERSLAA
jgi:4-hydroxy-tetrahydrodipicolinate synthase